MALIELGRASVQVGDSAKKLASASFLISAANAEAWVAAADQTARDATNAGKLLTRALNITRAAGTEGYKLYEVCKIVINDAFAFPASDAGVYNSNRWKVTGKTTNAGVPALDTIYVPEYLITGVVMESDGISADLTDAPISNFVTEFLATALSKYYTAFTQVVSIQRNDS